MSAIPSDPSNPISNLLNNPHYQCAFTGKPLFGSSHIYTLPCGDNVGDEGLKKLSEEKIQECLKCHKELSEPACDNPLLKRSLDHLSAFHSLFSNLASSLAASKELLEQINPTIEISLPTIELSYATVSTEQEYNLRMLWNAVQKEDNDNFRYNGYRVLPEEGPYPHCFIEKTLNDPKIIRSLNISDLNLSNSGMTNVPDELYNFTSLIGLNLYNNNISKLSEKILKLKNLSLNKNAFTEVPTELIAEMSRKSLDRFNICENKIPKENLQDQIGELKREGWGCYSTPRGLNVENL